MIKLIKPVSEGKYIYWEYWEDDEENTIVIHEGSLGDAGETTEIDAANPKIHQILNALIEEKKQEGFHELDEEILSSITIQYVIEGFGTEEDLEKRNLIIDAVDDILGWTGNGQWLAADIGANTMNVNYLVVDIDAATHSIVECLRENNWLEGAVIAHETEDENRVLFPVGARFFL